MTLLLFHWWLDWPFEQRDALRAHRFAAPHSVDLFAGFGFHANVMRRNFQQFGNSHPHSVFVVAQFWPLEHYNAIDVYYPPILASQSIANVRDHAGRIATTMGRIRVRKQIADVPHRSGPQQCVNHRMQQRIGIAMADRMLIVLDRHSAQPQRAACFQSMQVRSNSDPKIDSCRIQNCPPASASLIICPNRFSPEL
jgi:hypothetical protein